MRSMHCSAINGRLEPQTDGGRLLGLDPEDGLLFDSAHSLATASRHTCITSPRVMRLMLN